MSSGSGFIRKEVRLTRQLAYLALIGSAFYLLFDAISGAYAYLSIYLILIAGSLLALFLIRKGKTNIAKASLLISGNIIVSCFGSVETLQTGIFFYFVLLSVASLTLYGYENLKKAFIFVGLSTLLFLLLFFTDIQLISEVELTEKYIQASLVVNFLLILLATSLIVFYLLQSNYISERALNAQRESLIKATSELEKSQRRFELAIQGSSAAIWDWDIKKDYLFVTPKVSEILNVPLEEIQGWKRSLFMSSIHPDDEARAQNMLNEHLKNRKHFEVEFRLRNGEGEYIWILDSGQAEWDRNGNPVRMVGTLVDINEKKLVTEQVKEQNLMLAKANEELDRFVYSTSHDLRAPLSSLLGLINLASSSTEKTERDILIKMMKDQITKLDSYIQDITDYSRNSRVEIEKEEFLLFETVDEAIQNLRYMEGAEKFQFIVDIDKRTKLLTDKQRFKTIINNLISNAIKYQSSGEGSFLRISQKKNSKFMELIFEDNGTGIQPDHQKRVFDMFYRASEISRGSGLGLYIAREMARKLEGDLTLTSEVNKGSVFILKIPA